MSDYVPFEIQSEIIKRLLAKSLGQFRSVSKQWKAFIDNPEFIKNYHINHRLLIHYIKVDTYTSIIDDNTFPNQKFPLTAPEPLSLLTDPQILGSVDGLLCFYGWHKDTQLKHHMAVLWNPCIRKSVSIPIPDVLDTAGDNFSFTRIGFGVCRDTNDPTLVKINVLKTISWEVQVFTLSSRVWKTVYAGAPFKTSYLNPNPVFLDGIIYWSSRPTSIISFDLKSKKFGEVILPKRLLRACESIHVVKVNESLLGLLEYYKESKKRVCGVWMRKGGVNKPFTQMYTVKVEGKNLLYRVLGFRNSGEVVLALVDDCFKVSQIKVYEPSSRRINSVGISGDCFGFRACSYMETLLLLDQSNAIIQ